MRSKASLGRTCTFFSIYAALHWNNTNRTSKPFLEALGNEGLNKMLAGFDDKTAEAVCTFAYCGGPGQEPTIFQGRTEVSCNQSQ